MTEARLAAVATLQAHKIRRLEHQLDVVRKRNEQLRSRVHKLQVSRDLWRDRATGNRTTINRLRSRVSAARQSRDLWKHRTMTKGDAII